MTVLTDDERPGDSSASSQDVLHKENDTDKLEASEDEIDYPKGIQLVMILTSVTLAFFLFFLDLAVISTATPAITSQFDSLVDVGW